MASVNYLKLKGGADVARIIRHCDKLERQKSEREHANIHIDKSKSEFNGQMGQRGDYKKTMAYYHQRIADLDATTNTNHRKDRVTAFSLEVPVPENMPINEFANIVGKRVTEMYGKQNIVNLYVHQDEQHEYIDHGEKKLSRNHVHAVVIPEIHGKLNGKQFSSKSNMKRLNALIDKDCQQRGFIFMTGAEPRKKSVEELKRASEKELQDIKQLQGKYERLRAFTSRYKTKSGQTITELFDQSEIKQSKPKSIELDR